MSSQPPASGAAGAVRGLPSASAGRSRDVAVAAVPPAVARGQVHVVKSGRARATVRLCELRQHSTEPYAKHKDNQGGFQTGQYLWDSGLYLARWVLEQRARFRGQRAVELGSGLGLPGLVAAKFAAEAVLTDCAADIVDNLREAIELNGLHTQPPARAPADANSAGSSTSGGNSGSGGGEGGGNGDDDAAPTQSASPPPPSGLRCHAEILDWTAIVGGPRAGKPRQERVTGAAAEGGVAGNGGGGGGGGTTTAAAAATTGGGDAAADVAMAPRAATVPATGGGGAAPGAGGVGTFDVVLASDCIYMVAMAPLVAGVVAALLRPGGFAMLVFPEGRPGVPEFLKLMRGGSLGRFKVSTEPLPARLRGAAFGIKWCRGTHTFCEIRRDA